jgi:hypothetical protein
VPSGLDRRDCPPCARSFNRLPTPAFQAEVEKYGAIPLLREGWRAISIVPALINGEQQALGLSTSELVIEDRRAASDSIADAIASDLDAMDAIDGAARPSGGEGKGRSIAWPRRPAVAWVVLSFPLFDCQRAATEAARGLRNCVLDKSCHSPGRVET